MPLVRALCEKQTCAHNDNGHCICPTTPKFTCPEEITVEGSMGSEITVGNDTFMQCENYVKKG
jgi:hypothetical protein